MRALTLVLAASVGLMTSAIAQDGADGTAATPTEEAETNAEAAAEEEVEAGAEETADEVEPAAEEADDTAAEETPELKEATTTVDDQDVSSLSDTHESIGELQPSQIEVLAVEPVVTDAQRQAFEATSEQLRLSIEQARVATDAAKTRAKTNTQEVKVAKAQLTTAKHEYTAAKSEWKVRKLQDDGTAERRAAEAMASAKTGIRQAKDQVKVKSLELSFAKAKLKHAMVFTELEEAKLMEVEGRAANPPIEQSDLLSLEKDRLKSEGAEAKARGKAAKAELKLEKARG